MEESIRQAQAFAPWESELYFIEGRMKFSLGKKGKNPDILKQAAQAFLNHSHMSPSDPRPYFWLGNARLAQFELTNHQALLRQAKEAYQKAASKDPSNPEVKLQLGIVAFYSNNIREAIKEWENASYLAPKDKAPLKNLIVAYEKIGKTKRAQQLRQGLERLKD